MKANTPTPSRKARKIILPRAYSANGGLTPRSPAHQNRSGAVSGRSEPWRRTLNPLAQSAKDHASLSLLSDRRPDTAEPTKNRAERCRAGASLGGEHPNPSRIARKILLPRAYSASGGPTPRSPPKTAAERCRAGASLGGEHPRPSRIARKILLSRAYSASGGLMPRSPPKTAAERCRAAASLGGEHLSPPAQSAKAHPPQSLLSERRPDTAEPLQRQRKS